MASARAPAMVAVFGAHGLALEHLGRCSFAAGLNDGHRGCFRRTLPAPVHVAYRDEVLAPRRRRLLRVIKCLVLLKHFVFAHEDPVGGG